MEREKEKMRHMLDELAASQADLERRMDEQLKMHKSALEVALNSIVRLCVVAPTVNVHMGNQTSTFKAPLPHHKLRGFVEDQVTRTKPRRSTFLTMHHRYSRKFTNKSRRNSMTPNSSPTTSMA